MSFVYKGYKDYQNYYEVLNLIEKMQPGGDALKGRRLSSAKAKKDLLSEKKAETLLQNWLGLSKKPSMLLNLFYSFSRKSYFKEALKLNALQKRFGKASMIKIETASPYSALKIVYGIAPSPFGACFIALTDGRICKLSFIDKEERNKNNLQNKIEKPRASRSKDAVLAELSHAWPKAKIEAAHKQSGIDKIGSLAIDIFCSTNKTFSLLVHGSDLQLKVWQALLDLQKGTVAAYSQLAQYIGIPRSVRPVAGAVAKNPISYLVPCHRVISKNGIPHAYRWGRERKLAMLLWEAALVQAA